MVGAMGGSLLLMPTWKERKVSTPPLLRTRETKHDKLSTKYFLSFFIPLSNPTTPTTCQNTPNRSNAKNSIMCGIQNCFRFLIGK